MRWVLLAFLPTVVHSWDYSQQGEDWIRDDLGLCAGGGSSSMQSPIDLSLSSVSTTNLRKMFLKYPAFENTLNLYNSGHALAFTLPEAYKAGFAFVPSEADLQSTSADIYRAWQVNFHAPSEHTMAGRRFPLEMQVVHQRVTGTPELAVVSVLFQDDDASPSPFLAALLEPGLPKQAWEDVDVSFVRGAIGSAHDDKLGLQPVLANSTFFAYEGSMTSPPCDTGVQYFVRMEPRTASSAQLRTISEVLLGVAGPLGNYRRQPLSSEAGNVVVVGAVDSIGGGETTASAGLEYAKDAMALSGSAAARARETIATTPELDGIENGDSPELQDAKEHFKQAQLSEAAALQSKTDKTTALEQVEAEFNAALGSVLRIQLKMKVAEAQTAVSSAADALRAATQVADEAALKLVETWRAARAQHADAEGIAQTETTTASPTEFGSAQVATTALPFVEGQVWGSPSPAPSQLVYPGPTVTLPRGLAASPFAVAGAAQTQVAISGESAVGLDSTERMRLTPNLRQQDGPDGSVGLPYRTSALLETNAARQTVQGSARRPSLLARRSGDRQNKLTP